jgi:hypothetical protein
MTNRKRKLRFFTKYNHHTGGYECYCNDAKFELVGSRCIDRCAKCTGKKERAEDERNKKEKKKQRDQGKRIE